MKKIIIFILTLLIVINCNINLNGLTDEENEFKNEVLEMIEKTSNDYNYKCLLTFENSDILQELYWKVDELCKEYMTNYDVYLPTYAEVEMPDSLINKELKFNDHNEFNDFILLLQMAFYAYQRDHPMIYFIHNSKFGFGTFIDDGKYEITDITLSFDRNNGSGYERYNRNKILCTKIKEYASYVEGIDSQCTKAMIFAHLISKNMYYLYDENGKPSNEEFAHNLTGLFVYGKGVCETYAYAYSALLNYVGVDCIYVNGRSENASIGHAWNIVKLNDDQWYWFDVNNADNEKTGNIDGQYLGFNDEVFKKYNYALNNSSINGYMWTYHTVPTRGENSEIINDWYTINLNGVLYQIFYNKARVLENNSNQELPETIELIIGTFTTECLHNNVISKDNCSYCLNCLNMLHKIAHDKGVQETCTEDGITKGKHCSECNAIIEEQVVIPKKGHTESDWIVLIEPTKTEEGYRYKECLECYEIIYEETLPKLNSVNNWIVIIVAIAIVAISGITCVIIINKKRNSESK